MVWECSVLVVILRSIDEPSHPLELQKWAIGKGRSGGIVAILFEESQALEDVGRDFVDILIAVEIQRLLNTFLIKRRLRLGRHAILS